MNHESPSSNPKKQAVENPDIEHVNPESKKRANLLISRVENEFANFINRYKRPQTANSQSSESRAMEVDYKKKKFAIKKVLPYLVSLVFSFHEGIMHISKDMESFSNRAEATKDLAEKGITNERRMGYVKGVSEFIYSTVPPVAYQTVLEVLSDIPANAIGVIQDSTTQQKTLGNWEKLDEDQEGKNFISRTENIEREDAWRLYLGLPQEYGTFSVSEFQPSNEKDNKFYYSIKDWIGKLRKGTHLQLTVKLRELKQLKQEHMKEKATTKWAQGVDFSFSDYDRDKEITDLEQEIQSFSDSKVIEHLVTNALTPESDGKYSLDFAVFVYKDDYGNIVTTETSYEDRYSIMGRFKLSLGKDNLGSYISYYDKWDLANNQLEGIIGKAFEIYDRIYYNPNTFEPFQQKK